MAQNPFLSSPFLRGTRRNRRLNWAPSALNSGAPSCGSGTSTAPEHKRCCYKLAKLPIVRKARAGKSRPLASSSRRPGAAIKANPLIMLEIAARALVARLLGRLGVLDSGEKDALGRPPKLGR